MGLYDRADIYDLIENEERFQMYERHWKTVFHGKDIRSMLDVSIGSGSVTLPVIDLGIELSGSDLSEAMLENCRNKIEKKLKLKCSDFRDLSCWGDEQFDCVASTGNSLAYVTNADVLKTLEQMDAHIKCGGYLYLDIRNWTKILAEKPRFYIYNPFFHGPHRINLVQCWDYNADETVTFNLLYTFEENNRIFQKEIFQERYYPLPKELLLRKLEDMGYEAVEQRNFPACVDGGKPESWDWFCLMARKAR